MSSKNERSTIDVYYDEIRENESMTRQEQEAWFHAYRTCTKCQFGFKIDDARVKCPECDNPRNLWARDRIIASALRYVVKAAKVYAQRAHGHSYDDLVGQLISAGNWGLLIAVDKFDPKVGTRYLTYAAYWVAERIRVELDGLKVVAVPSYKQKDVRARRRQGDSVPDDALIVLEEVSDLLQEDDAARPNLERKAIDADGARMLYGAFQELNLGTRERYILTAYFGLKEEPKNLRQIATRLQVSAEWVRQLKEDVIARLKPHLERRKKVKAARDIFYD